jgi:dCMP deaminase
MKICEDLSKLSHDPKYQVATIIISDDFREICSIGYNGDFRGGPNERLNLEQGQSGFLHSEENALFHLGRPFKLRSDLILICTHKPCSMCAKRIANSGIKRVVYKSDYVDLANETNTIFQISRIDCQSFDSLFSSKELLEVCLKHST